LKRFFIYVLISLIVTIAAYLNWPERRIDSRVGRIVVYKSQRIMNVYSPEGNLLKAYKIALGKNPTGDKQFEGDNKTPEGIYTINDKNPNSGYHKNLGVSYPNEKDIEEAKTFNKSAGGDIKIHGIRNYMGFIGKFHRLTDWTRGCIAVTDAEIDELYEHTPIGTPIEIKE
jgi:murein L,D-transpeptidase YafK